MVRLFILNLSTLICFKKFRKKKKIVCTLRKRDYFCNPLRERRSLAGTKIGSRERN